MQVQRHPRLAKRMSCAVHVGSRRYAGFVLNVSRSGVYVQTTADAGRGSRVSVDLNAPGERDGIPLEGVVAWRRVVPGQLQQMAAGGFGVSIERADERYYAALSRWMGEEPGAHGLETEAAAAPVADAPTWRVRIRAEGSPRSRTLTVEAASPEDARAAALAHADGVWRVIEIESL